MRKNEVYLLSRNIRPRFHGHYKCFSYNLKPEYLEKMGYGYENTYQAWKKDPPNYNSVLK